MALERKLLNSIQDCSNLTTLNKELNTRVSQLETELSKPTTLCMHDSSSSNKLILSYCFIFFVSDKIQKEIQSKADKSGGIIETLR